MKNLKFSRVALSLLLLLFSSVLILSCLKEEKVESVDKHSNAISVFGEDAQSGLQTKTSLNGIALSWVEGDKIGIFCAEARPSPGGAAGVSNVVYTAQQSAPSSEFTGSMYWSTGLHNFYSYYPHSLGGFTPFGVPVTLPGVQTQQGTSSAHLSGLDFLVADPIIGMSPGAENSSTTVNFSFNHLFALLEFRVSSSLATRRVTEVELEGPEGTILSIVSGTLNITAATPAVDDPYTISSLMGSNIVKVNITEGVLCGPTFESSPGIFIMINPINFSGKNLIIRIKDNSETVQTFTRSGANFKRGTKYLVKVTEPEDGGDVVWVDQKGSLGTILSEAQKSSITRMTLKGEINAADFDVMKNHMPNLTYLNLKDVICEGNYLPDQALGHWDSPNRTITTIILPTSITAIGHWAFGVTKLTGSLTLPAGLTTIGISAFQGCSGFTGSLTIPTGVKVIEFAAFANLTGLTGSLTLHNQVTKIDTLGFYGSKFSGEVVLPASLTAIAGGGFDLCSAVTAFKFPHTTPLPYTTVAANPEDGIPGGTMLPAGATVKVPFAAVAIYQAADGWKTHTIEGYTP